MAMISSVKVPEKKGKPLSISYSRQMNQVVVGTSHGLIFVIDDRNYQILGSNKAHEKKVNTICIDSMQQFYVTGGGEGSVKIWDLRKHSLIDEKKELHKSKSIHEEGKWKTLGVTDIVVRDDNIYTCGIDKKIYSMRFFPE